MSVKTFGRRGLGALFSAAALSGCFLTTRDSAIENGESVNIGRKRFDDYFDEVATLRDEVEKLDPDLFPLRQPLVEELDLGVDVAIGDLLVAARDRAKKVRDFGVSMTLQLRPTPRVIDERGELESDDKQETLIKAIEESANRAMQSFEQYSALLDKATELEKQRAGLAERVDKLPADIDRDQVERELAGAGVVIRKSEGKLLRSTRTISHFLVGLVAAVDTGAAEARQGRCDEALAQFEEKKKAPPKPSPRPRWRPPTGPRPGPKPPPRPSGGGDFEM